MALLPIHDDNPTRRRPWVTYLLIAVNVVVFLASPLSPSGWPPTPLPGGRYADPWATSPPPRRSRWGRW